METEQLIEYYRLRARDYDDLYLKADRQEDLSQASEILQDVFEHKDVVEVACGTGYWTLAISNTARSVLATDINDTMLEIAEARCSDQDNVQFSMQDMYKLDITAPMDALFGGFIWSHILLEDLPKFLDAMEGYVKPGGTLAFMDNRFVAGSNTPIAHTDPDGNTYQERLLQDGSRHRILKNFPTEDFLRQTLKDRAAQVEYISLDHYWILSYTKA